MTPFIDEGVEAVLAFIVIAKIPLRLGSEVNARSRGWAMLKEVVSWGLFHVKRIVALTMLQNTCQLEHIIGHHVMERSQREDEVCLPFGKIEGTRRKQSRRNVTNSPVRES